ncbi:MAG TPA: protein-disulfide reductase DsbD domain-containing protein [Caulobacterales bacterium]|nr:protein-disulfide reductase DsbD domain-containing protein [Caulobacterales bacterium]
MRVGLLFAAFLSAAAALFAGVAAAEPFRTPHVEIELHAARAAVAPGERFWIVLRQKMQPGWHTYWRNPGVAGQPTEISWTLPRGFSAGPINWPAPETVAYTILVNYAYSGEVLYPIEITAPRNAAPGAATLSANVSWLVCADQCIPEQGVVTLTLPVTAQGADDPTWAPRIAAARAALPQPAPFTAHVSAPALLTATVPDALHIRNPYFFSDDADKVDATKPQHPRVGAGGLSFTLVPASADAKVSSEPLTGVLTYEVRAPQGWTRHAVELSAQPGAALPNTDAQAATMSPDFVAEAPSQATGGAPPAAPSAPVEARGSLLSALVFAVLGGLILNIMPCVLPVLSIKALGLAGGLHAGEAKRHGVFYLIGVMATFLALAALLIALREAGQAIGWGFQLQTPWVTAGLALLFFAIALNLIGAFEIGGSVQNAGAGLAARNGDIGAFFTGALAVVAATPCTAPFMASAVGFAVTQSPPATLAVFAGLGLGFAAPLTVLSFAPALQRLIPKPGPWMERVRNVLAFPMFAAANWLAWVLTQQAGANGMAALAMLALALAFAVFVGRWGRVGAIVGLAVLALGIGLAWRPLTDPPANHPRATEEAWSAERVAAAQSEGRGVFVNFTAAWCATCKVNEALAFTPRVHQAFAAKNIVYLEGDWTNRDAAIAAELARHGRAGVPLYLYYAPGAADPVVLPQTLTEGAVLNAIGAR